MLENHLKRIAIIMAGALIATAASAADTVNAGADRQHPSAKASAALNRILAREANTAAAEDAIEAVLNANRLHLDTRLNGRTSARTSEESMNGR